GVVKRPDSLLIQPPRQGHRRELGAVKNLIRIRVPDSAEESRVRQAAFHRVVRRGEPFRKGVKAGLEYLQASRIEGAQPLRAPDKVKRGSLARSCLDRKSVV